MGESHKIVDFDGFLDETGLDKEVTKELYTGLIEEIVQEREKILSELAAMDFGKLARTVHNIKGISGSYKLQYVFKQAGDIDACIKQSRLEGVEAAVGKLQTLINEAVTEIRRHFDI